MNLKDNWDYLTQKYSNNEIMIEKLFFELEKKYSEKHRYYHTLNHIESLINLIEDYKEKISDIHYIFFSVWYHDAIYNTLKKNNEEKSSALAAKRLKDLNVDNLTVNKIKMLIISTKNHLTNPEIDNFDAKLFLDCDLSILGANIERYKQYMNEIRLEYSIYPDLLYNKGRIKVLEHFLNMSRIYKTDEIYERFEKQARENLKYELETLYNFI